ncbi:hypothetical protein L2E82_13174 [Cichorium intybus]|uniref:Uncharacterized protein n=1 Tax=Cichorium intybus TaxID=13427 RepID=A0ACB9GI19_CICIN|nr:hypothetical protein L2E82_13174 [Cichorium intybus]
MAYNQPNERPARSCCEKIHKALFGSCYPKKNETTNDFSTVEPHVSSTQLDSVPREEKVSEHVEHSSSNNVEDDSNNDTVSGSISHPKVTLIPRPRVDFVGKTLKP